MINKRNVKILISIIIFILVIVLFSKEPPRPYSNPADIVRLSELTLCKGLEDSTNRPIELEILTVENTTPLFVCGYLKSHKSQPLTIYWKFRGDKQVPFYKNRDQPFSPGYFASKLDIGRPLSPGIYEVEVHLYRSKIGHLEFDIHP